MIDFSPEIAELEECRGELGVFGARLFDLEPDTPEAEFATQEMFALSAKIILIRYKIQNILTAVEDKLDDEGIVVEGSDENPIEVIHQECDKDFDLPGIIVSEMVELKRNNLPLSFISRYQDIIGSVVSYCRTMDSKFLRKRFRDISVADML